MGKDTNADGIADYYDADVENARDFYPFCMTQPGREYTSNLYRYGFNGKEDDKDWGVKYVKDYGFRLYNPAIGKFLSVDPLSTEFPWNSVYAFAENDVIRCIDLEGGEKRIYTIKYSKDPQSKEMTWTTTKIELQKAGKYGDGVMVKVEKGNKALYFMGTSGGSTTTVADMIKHYEGVVKDKDGNHIAHQVGSEGFNTIGYGHTIQSKEDIEKYHSGTKITEEEAISLLEGDIKKREVAIYDYGKVVKHKSDAMIIHVFQQTNDPFKKGVKIEKFMKTPQKERPNFLISNTPRTITNDNRGRFKRLAAEHLLYNFNDYLFLDYSRTDQDNFRKEYEKLTEKKQDGNEKKKP